MKNLFTRPNLLQGFIVSFFITVWGSAVYSQIEEVIVTAQKRVEDVQDVPISISTFSGDFMEDSGINTLQELGQYSPNLTLSHSSQVANQRIIMRGVGSVGNSAIEPSVAVFIDGVYYPRPSSVVGSLTDLEMVEVLRGPQGTLFGRNSSVGALNIRTAKPSDEFEGKIRASYGDYDAIRIAGALSGGLTENTSGRVSFQYSDRDGYGDNTFTNGGSRGEAGAWEDVNLRGKLYFTPTDDLDITLTLDYAKVENEGGVIEVKSDTVLTPTYQGILGLVLDTNSVPGAVPPGALGIGQIPEVNNTFDYTLNQDHRDDAEDEQWGLAADISWRVGEHTVRSITGYRNWENDTFESALRLPANLLNRNTHYEVDTFSEELQLLSPTGGFLEYVAGIYYYDEEYKIDGDFDLGPNFCQAASNAAYLLTFGGALAAGAPLAVANAAGLASSGPAFAACNPPLSQLTAAVDGNFSQDLSSFAIYGQTTFNITDQFRLTGGLRWTSDDKEGTFSQAVNNIALSPAILDLRINEAATALNFDDDELTWLVNASYYPTDDIMVFGTISTGFKSGGFNSDGFNSIGIASGSRTFNSESVDNYEIGIKSVLFDNRMTANLTFFITEISDFQDRQFDGVNFFVQNAGELTQQGFELDITARPVDQLYAVLGVSYLDSEFDSFPNATNLPAIVAATQAANRVLPVPIAVPPLNLAGQSNHFSPEWQLSLVAEWADALPNTDWSWFLRGEYSFIDEQNVGAETNQNPQSIQESYDVFNARFGLRGADDKWELSGFIRNAFDQEYCQTVFNQPIGTTLNLVDPATGGGMQRCVLGTPRTFGVEAAYRF